jgi:hypothetical protein
MDELAAKVHEATMKWNAMSPEEKMRVGRQYNYSTPGYARRVEESPGPPFSAWARVQPNRIKNGEPLNLCSSPWESNPPSRKGRPVNGLPLPRRPTGTYISEARRN